MELLLRKKRKGSDAPTLDFDFDDQPPQAPITTARKTPLFVGSSHLSLEDACTRRRRKKCKEHQVVLSEDALSSGGSTDKRRARPTGIVTAPPCGSSLSHLPGRGIKRKIGCIDVATKMGRKKKIEQDYILGDEIGKGRFGSVRSCTNKSTAVEFACKSLCKGEETVHREVEIMQHLSGHPGVVTLKAVYEDSDCFYLVMELCSGGRLVDQMVKEAQFSERRAACMIKEVMLVIKYCHEMGVVHRDIKPENILLTSSGKMKLADFGLATRITDGQSLSGVAGSPAYVAPEVLVGNYSEKVDVWSAGVLLHALLVGSLPFQGDSLEAVFEAIKKVDLSFNGGMWESVSELARDLIGRMLTRDVSSRVTADEVLRHPWISFYTEQALKRSLIKSKGNNHVGDLSRQLAACSFQPEVEEQDDCRLADVLAVAISRVRISEPKRSRLCTPSSPIQQDCSSTVKANNLCTAF